MSDIAELIESIDFEPDEKFINSLNNEEYGLRAIWAVEPMLSHIKSLEAEVERLSDQITNARSVLTDYATHNPTLERVLVEARLKLKVVSKGDD